MSVKNIRVEQCVEVMCQKGCKQIWADIETLESGDMLPELADFSSVERAQVLVELKAIMAVYNNSGSCAAE